MQPITRRHLIGLAAAAVATALSACGKDDVVEPKFSNGLAELAKGDNRVKVERAPAGDPKGAARAMCDFAARLAQTLSARTGGGNLLVSPASLATPLAMLANGAAAETLRELTELLGGQSIDELNAAMNTVLQTLATRSGKFKDGRRKGEVHLDIANSLWLKQGWKVKQRFMQASAQWYGAGVHGIDPNDPRACADAVNEWAAEHTNDRIKNLLSPEHFTDHTRMVIANAVWLKAPWQDEFGQTRPGPFTTSNGEVQAQMMRGDADLAHVGPLHQACTKAYLGGNLSMALVLPAPGKEEQMLQGWVDGGLAEMLDGFQSSEVKLTMPKWAFEQELDLVEPLKALGMQHLFVDQQPNLSQLSDEPTGVSAIVQKTWIEVDEKGTEAAAATAAVDGVMSAAPPPEKLELVLDRPFWYVIHDHETLSPLFIGRVGNPTSVG